MKLSALPRAHGSRRGFTLVELLIVITLIAVLAGVSVPVYNGIMRRMRENQARVTALSIENSIKGYYAEYQKFPVPPGGGASEAASILTDEMIVPALIGKDDTLNPRGIRFLPELRDASDTRKNGLVMDGSAGASIVDPWGTPYNIRMDVGDYNGEIENPDPEATSSTLLKQVVVYSNGEDKEEATWDDNIASWTSKSRDAREK